MATLRDKISAALQVFRSGYPQRGAPQTKSAPFMVWPDWRSASPGWRMVDLQSYLEEGYSLNTLIYSAVMYKARAASTPPLRAYTGDPDSPELLPPDHPLSRLVARPNPSQSWREFQMLRTIFFNIAGESFAWLERKGADRGVPSALYVLDPQRVYIVPDRKAGRGVIGYIYVPEGKGIQDGYPLVPQDVIHTKLPNPADPLDGEGYGFSPLSPLARSADVDNMVTKFLQIFFERGAVVTGLLKFERAMNDATVAQVRERWKSIYGGFENWTTEVGVVDQGGSYEKISMSFEEMGFSDLDERNESRILGPFGVPPILIGSRLGLLRSTYANYKEARVAFWEDTLLSELGLFEDDYSYYLQSDDGGFVQFDYSDVPALRKDVPILVTAWAALVDRGVPKNIAGQVVGLDLPELPDGQVIYMPSTLAPVDGSGNSTRPTPPALAPFTEAPPPEPEKEPAQDNEGAVEAEEDSREGEKGRKAHKAGWTPEQKAAHWKAVDKIATSWEPKFAGAAAEAFEADRRGVLAILNGGKASSLRRKATVDWEAIAGEVMDFLQGASSAMWRKLFTPLVRGVVVDQGKRWSANLGMTFDVTNLEAADFFDKYTLKFAQQVGQTTIDDISEIMAEAQVQGASIPQVQKQLDALFDRYADNATPDDPDWKWFTDRAPAYRKELIARDQTLRSSNAGNNEIFNSWGLESREWLTAIDGRERPSHRAMNGKTVKIDEPFTFDDGSQVMFPGDDSMGAPLEQIIQCRCQELPIVPEEA